MAALQNLCERLPHVPRHIIKQALEESDMHAGHALRLLQSRCGVATPPACTTSAARTKVPLPSAVPRAVRAAFNAVDVDGSGTIDAGELVPALRKLGLSATRADAAAIISRYGRRNGYADAIDVVAFDKLVRDLAAFQRDETGTPDAPAIPRPADIDNCRQRHSFSSGRKPENGPALERCSPNPKDISATHELPSEATRAVLNTGETQLRAAVDAVNSMRAVHSALDSAASEHSASTQNRHQVQTMGTGLQVYGGTGRHEQRVTKGVREGGPEGSRRMQPEHIAPPRLAEGANPERCLSHAASAASQRTIEAVGPLFVSRSVGIEAVLLPSPDAHTSCRQFHHFRSGRSWRTLDIPDSWCVVSDRYFRRRLPLAYGY